MKTNLKAIAAMLAMYFPSVLCAQIKASGMSGSTVTGTVAPATIVVVGNGSIVGGSNTFVGNDAGLANTNGTANAFLGTMAGKANTTGFSNTFIGQFTGVSNLTGQANTFVGQGSGAKSTGNFNTLIGSGSGNLTAGANLNTFLGTFTGSNNTSGSDNVFLGGTAGQANTIGNRNIAIGTSANFSSPSLTNAIAIGSNSLVSLNNSMALGGTGANAVNVGIGTPSPAAHLHLVNAAQENVIFSTTNPANSSTLSIAAGVNNLTLSMNGPSVTGNVLPAGIAPAVPNANLGLLNSFSGPLMLAAGNPKESGNIHFVSAISGPVAGSLVLWESMRINSKNGFVGVHTRNAASAAGTGEPQAMFHVNLTNPGIAGINPMINGIRFEGLPAANHADVVVIDGAGNLGRRPYPSISGGAAWLLGGNSITSPATEFIGTLTDQDFVFRTNNIPRGRITSNGSYGNFDLGANNTFPGVSDMSAAIGRDNVVNMTRFSLAAGDLNVLTSASSAGAGAKNQVVFGQENSMSDGTFSLVSGLLNKLENSAGSIVAGTQNVMINNNSSAIAGSGNKTISSGTLGNNAALGEENETVESHACINLGEGNKIVNSDESGVIGEKNTMTGAHGGFIGGGHNTTVGGKYNVALGDNLTAANPLSGGAGNIHVYGSRITNDLPQSMAMGFEHNRTMVVSSRGVAIQMSPASVSTIGPAYNLEVNADPAGSGVASNIVFHKLPLASEELPAVVVDGTGALFMSNLKYAKGASPAGVAAITDKRIYKSTAPVADALKLIGKMEPKICRVDGASYPSLSLQQDAESYSITAQDLEKVLPGAVSEIAVPQNGESALKETVKAVNYNELIPILVQAVKDQQANIEGLQSQIREQKNMIDKLTAADNKSSGDITMAADEPLAKIDVELSDKDAIVLNQNIPNPWSKSTVISFHIPESVRSAAISFSTIEGKSIKSIPVAAHGKGIINVHASDLSSGVYIYTLVADGRVVDSKKMIVNK